MVKFYFLLLLLCATAHAAGLPSRLSQDHSQNPSGSSEIELAYQVEFDKPSETEISAPLCPNVLEEPSGIYRLSGDVIALIASKLSFIGEGVVFEQLCKSITINYTRQQREAIESIEEETLILKKYKDYNDIEEMVKVLEPILLNAGIAKGIVLNKYQVAIVRLCRRRQRTDAMLLQYLREINVFGNQLNVEQCITEARETINQEFGRRVTNYNDEARMDREIKYLLRRRPEDTFAKDILLLLPSARDKVKRKKEKLGVTKLENYDGDERMTKMLERLSESTWKKARNAISSKIHFMVHKLRCSGEGYQKPQPKKQLIQPLIRQIMQEARWRVTLRLAIELKMKYMVHKLLHFEQNPKDYLGPHIRLAVQLGETDILKMLLQFTGSTKGFETALREACRMEDNGVGFNTLTFLLGDERSKSSDARNLLVKESNRAVRKGRLAAADFINKAIQNLPQPAT